MKVVREGISEEKTIRAKISDTSVCQNGQTKDDKGRGGGDYERSGEFIIL